MDTSLETEFNDAIKLRDKGDLHGALHHFQKLSQKYPHRASIYGMLGHLHWLLGSLPEAIQCFQTVVKLSPKSELGSLGLFHALWKAGQRNEALKEMKRFLSLADSEEYKAILSEKHEELTAEELDILGDG